MRIRNDCSNLGSILGSPYFGKLTYESSATVTRPLRSKLWVLPPLCNCWIILIQLYIASNMTPIWIVGGEGSTQTKLPQPQPCGSCIDGSHMHESNLRPVCRTTGFRVQGKLAQVLLLFWKEARPDMKPNILYSPDYRNSAKGTLPLRKGAALTLQLLDASTQPCMARRATCHCRLLRMVPRWHGKGSKLPVQ